MSLEVPERFKAVLSDFDGDNAVADITGAAGAGMHTAWMSYGRSWTIQSCRPDHVIRDVWDVRPLLGI